MTRARAVFLTVMMVLSAMMMGVGAATLAPADAVDSSVSISDGPAMAQSDFSGSESSAGKSFQVEGRGWGTVSDDPSQDFVSGKFTIEMWVKPDEDSAKDAKILRQGTGNGWYIEWQGTGDARPIDFTTSNCCDIGLTSNSDVPAGVWTHLALVYDGSQLTLYINGEKDATSSDSNAASGQGDLHFGSNAATNGNFYDGRIDNVRFWDAARSIISVQDKRFDELSGSESGLTALYQFDGDASGGPGTNLAGSGNVTLNGDASIVNDDSNPVAPHVHTEPLNGSARIVLDPRNNLAGGNDIDSYNIYRSTSSDPTTASLVTSTTSSSLIDTGLINGETYYYWATAVVSGTEGDISKVASVRPYGQTEESQEVGPDGGQGGRSLSVNGRGWARASPRPSFDFVSDKFTVEFWVKPKATSDDNARLVSAAGNSGWAISWEGSGESRPVRFQTFTCCDIDLTTDTEVQAGVWTHVAFTYDGSQLAAYINGELAGTTNDNNYAGGAGEVKLGSNLASNANFFAGQIDDLRFWDASRGSSAIAANYTSELVGNEANLAGYWQFDTRVSSGASATEGSTYRHGKINFHGDAQLSEGGAYPVGTYTRTVSGNGSVTVSWTDRTDWPIDAYKVWRKPASGDRTAWSPIATIDNVSLTQYVDTGVSNGQNYHYAVTTVDADGQESDLPRGSPASPYKDRGGSALALDGSSYAEATDRPSFDFVSNEFTIEMWVKPDASSDSDANILRTSNSGSWGVRWVGSGEERSIRFFTDTCCDIGLTSNSGVPAGVWTHVAFTYDGSQLAVYINGELDSTTSDNNGAAGNSKVVFGSSVAGNSNFFAGQVDEVAFWNDARTKEEIGNTYDSRLSGNESDLVHYWRFDNEGGSESRSVAAGHATVTLQETAALGAPGVMPVPPRVYARADGGSAEVSWEVRNPDTTSKVSVYSASQRNLGDRSALASVNASLRSTYEVTGLTNGSTTFYQATAIDGDGQESDYAFEASALPSTQPAGNAFKFTGAGNSSYGSVSDRPSLDIASGSDGLTVEFWVNPDADSEEDAWLLRKNNAWGVQWVGTGAERKISFSADGCCNIGLTSDQTVAANTWTHVAFTYDGSEMSLYINGKLDSTSTETTGPGTSGNPLRLGVNAATNGQFFVGALDEIRLWKDYRTRSELTTNYDNELTGLEAGLSGYWRGPFTTGLDTVTGSAVRPMTVTLNNVEATASLAGVQGGGSSTTTFNVSLDGAPNGLQRYEIRVNATTGAVIRAVTPDLISGTQFQVSAGGPGSSSVTIRGADLVDNVGSFSDSRVLASIEFVGNVSASDVDVTVNQLVADDGSTISSSRVTTSAETSGGNPFTQAIPGTGASGPPTDTDGDGLYDDVNGDGVKNFDDAIALAFASTSGLNSQQKAALDFDGDGDVDFDDAVALAFL